MMAQITLSQIVNHSGQVTGFLMGLVALVAAVTTLVISVRRDGREAERLEADAEAEEGLSAERESDRLIAFLRDQRDEFEKALKRERDEFSRKVEGQESRHKREIQAQERRHKEEMTLLRKSLESRLDVLDKRVDMYGCENAASGCPRRRRVSIMVNEIPEGVEG